MNATNTVTETLPTVEEMLAAPESDYMSPRQLAFFRARLVAEKDALLSSAKDTTLHLQDYQTTPDPSDRATLEEDHTLELRVRDRERKLLHKIDQAITRIDDGSYGWCEESGEPIGIGRLIARPTASRSEERRVGKECRSRWSPY